MKELLHNIRFYILVLSILFSGVVYLFVIQIIPQEQLQTIRLNQLYGLTSIVFLYFALLAGPLCYTFPNIPFKKKYLIARRAIGVSSFYFALLHSLIAFFGQLGGLEGLGFLTTNYLVAISLSVAALFILLLLALTSFDAVIKKMTFPKWKVLQRFVYIAGVFVLIHMLMLGTHFSSLSSVIPQLFFSMLAFLFILEANRFDAFLQTKFPTLPRFGITVALILGLIVFWYINSLLPSTTAPLSVHSQHMQMAKDTSAGSMASMPGMQSLKGDKNLRYTVGFIKPNTILPNQETLLQFDVFNANNGSQTKLFQKLYTKSMHLVIVDNQLQYFAHIHPQQKDNTFSVTTSFPHPGMYRLYLNYQPVGAIEQQVAFSMKVEGDENTVGASKKSVDTNLTKVVGKYEVSMDTNGMLNADALSVGQQKITFTLKDAATKKPVTTLKPYLAAFGHLVMIDKKTYNYLHVHPTNLTPPKPDQNGGPTVSFLPFGLYGEIKPGIYRVFAEFNPDVELIVAEYTVRVY